MKAIYKALVDTLVQLGFVAIFILVVILIVQGIKLFLVIFPFTVQSSFILLCVLLCVAAIGVLLIPIAIFYENYIYYRRQK